MRKALFFSLALAPLALCAYTLAPSADGQITPSSDCNVIDRELVVNFDTSGGTLTGPINVSLQVFNTGQVRYSSVVGLNNTSSVSYSQANPQDVKNLQRDLRLAGATTLCDQTILFSDTPSHTLTVLFGGPTGKFHTFTFQGGDFGPGQNYGAVLTAINTFVAANVPNPGGGNTTF